MFLPYNYIFKHAGEQNSYSLHKENTPSCKLFVAYTPDILYRMSLNFMIAMLTAVEEELCNIGTVSSPRKTNENIR
jgi:hypothetical protein